MVAAIPDARERIAEVFRERGIKPDRVSTTATGSRLFQFLKCEHPCAVTVCKNGDMTLMVENGDQDDCYAMDLDDLEEICVVCKNATTT